MPVKPVPEGYHSVTPYLIVRGAARAMEFYKTVFGATELFRMDATDGKVGHAELQIGDSRVMIADEHPDADAVGPEVLGGSPVHLMLYVDDCDAVFRRAVENGATELRPLRDEFYGDRSGSLSDPFGHRWTIATHKEDVSPEEMLKRAQQNVQGV